MHENVIYRHPYVCKFIQQQLEVEWRVAFRVPRLHFEPRRRTFSRHTTFTHNRNRQLNSNQRAEMYPVRKYDASKPPHLKQAPTSMLRVVWPIVVFLAILLKGSNAMGNATAEQEHLERRQNAAPTRYLIRNATKRLSQRPARRFVRSGTSYSLVLESDTAMLRGTVVSSPSGKFQFGVYPNGNLQIWSSSDNKVIWRTRVKEAAKCMMQNDGNFVAQNANKTIIWQSYTSKHPGAILALDDRGQLTIFYRDSIIWLGGLPRGQYSALASSNMVYPLRGMFYYPWFPETWSVNKKPVVYRPTLGKYKSGVDRVHAAHTDALIYAHVDLAIASWWGPSQHLDRARITDLLVRARGTKLKWAVYHEKEYTTDQSILQIRRDLAYLKKWFAWHPTYGHIDGRPVIFVYNEAGCEVAARWNSANRGEWYLVLKVFEGHEDCRAQPDHWHQYGPAKAILRQPGHSFTVSPGFWRADEATPRLRRLNSQKWRRNILEMVQSNEDWQLITSFNEWGEGTSVEAAMEWASSSKYGFYLDALHDIR